MWFYHTKGKKIKGKYPHSAMTFQCYGKIFRLKVGFSRFLCDVYFLKHSKSFHSIPWLENVNLDTKTCLYHGYNPRYSHFKEKTDAILKIQEGG